MAVVNRTSGELRLSILGKNLTTKEVDLYQISIVTGEPLSFSSDPLSSGNYDMITVKGRNGSIVGQVQGDEQDPSGELSFSFNEDFSHLGKKHVNGNSKNRLLNILNGETFYNKGEKITPIGTNGTDKTTTARAKFNEMNKPYKYIFYNEGEFIKEQGTADPVTGKVSLKKNPYKSSFDSFNKTFCFEAVTTSSEGQVNRMFPILAKATAEWVEGDMNQFNCTANRGCDMWEKDYFLTDVYAMSATEAKDYMENYNEVYVHSIVVSGGTEPDTADCAGHLLLNIGEDGTVTIKKCGDTAWEEETELKKLITVGTRFKTRKIVDGTGIECNAFAVIGENGTNCVDFTTDGKKRYFCKVKDFDLKVSNEFEDFITIE